MITLYVGNIGSGKTASAVRDMALTPYRKYYSNITTIKLKNVMPLSADMLIKKENTGRISKGHEVFEYSLNKEFWENAEKPVSIVIDEIHSIMNARRSMSKINIIMTDWLALLRKMLGQTEAGEGELIAITQLQGRADIILREMAHRIKYFVCHYRKVCKRCSYSWRENSDMPEQRMCCPVCGFWELKKIEHKIEVKHFQDVKSFDLWKDTGMRTFHRNYIINDIEKYFRNYDTMQWDNLFSDY